YHASPDSTIQRFLSCQRNQRGVFTEKPNQRNPMPEDQPPSGTPPASGTPPTPSPTPAPTLAPTPDQKEREARTWNMWCHMSALAGLIVPLGNVIGPLIIWQMKKLDFP